MIPQLTFDQFIDAYGVAVAHQNFLKSLMRRSAKTTETKGWLLFKNCDERADGNQLLAAVVPFGPRANCRNIPAGKLGLLSKEGGFVAAVGMMPAEAVADPNASDNEPYPYLIGFGRTENIEEIITPETTPIK